MYDFYSILYYISCRCATVLLMKHSYSMKEISETSKCDLGEVVEMPRNTNISHKKRNVCRLLQMGIFILCCAGFAIQTTDFLTTFYSYPTVINIEIENMNEFPLPALTFCSPYLYRFDKFCEKLKDDCEIKTTDLSTRDKKSCEKYDFMCNPNKTNPVTIDSFRKSDELVPLNASEAFKGDYFEGPFQFSSILTRIPDVCYSWGTGLTSTGFRRMPIDIVKDRWKSFQISFVQSEHINFHELQQHGTLYVHSPLVSFSASSKSTPVKMGNLYSIKIHLEEERLLPAPYPTDCVDYIALWRKNNMSGPLSRDMCQHNCVWKSGYFEHMYSSAKTEIVCKGRLKNPGRKDSFSDGCKCSLKCKDDCSKLNYEVTPFETPNHKLRRNGVPEPYAHIGLFIESSKVRVLSFKPKYEDVELFSYIGGFLGCWLGISLWSSTGILGKGCSFLVTNIKEHRKTMNGRGKASKQKSPSF